MTDSDGKDNMKGRTSVMTFKDAVFRSVSIFILGDILLEPGQKLFMVSENSAIEP